MRTIPATPDDGDLERTDSEIFLFKPFGPFAVPAEGFQEFWENIEAEPRALRHRKGLRDAVGVYIFVTRASIKSAFIPRYVGMTKRGFERRFREHASKGVFDALKQKHRGTLHVFLLARRNKEGNSFLRTKARRESSINILEALVIERCLERNADLQNIQKAKYVKGIQVPGFINSHTLKLQGPATRLKAMLGEITTASGKERDHLLQAGSNIAVLAPDVVEHFPDSQSVNNALRAILAFGKQVASVVPSAGQPSRRTVASHLQADFDPRKGAAKSKALKAK